MLDLSAKSFFVYLIKINLKYFIY